MNMRKLGCKRMMIVRFIMIANMLMVLRNLDCTTMMRAYIWNNGFI